MMYYDNNDYIDYNDYYYLTGSSIEKVMRKVLGKKALVITDKTKRLAFVKKRLKGQFIWYAILDRFYMAIPHF